MSKISQWLLTAIKSPLGIFLILALVFFAAYSFAQWQIKRASVDAEHYKAQNDILLKQRDSLLAKSNHYLNDVKAREGQLKYQQYRDSLLQGQLSILNNKIQTIKALYEKASHTADHYDNDSIAWYFSTIK